MIVVRVELHSAITGQITELARMYISNIGGTRNNGNYDVRVLRGRDRDALNQNRVQRTGKVQNYPRLKLHVWNLVIRALTAAGYRPREE